MDIVYFLSGIMPNMQGDLSRRSFLKLSGLSLGALAMAPFIGPVLDMDGGEVIRMATHSISVYSQPDDKSTILYQRHRDDLVNVYDEIVSTKGPGYNPIWFKVWRGYIHSARVQKVTNRLNPVASEHSRARPAGRGDRTVHPVPALYAQQETLGTGLPPLSRNQRSGWWPSMKVRTAQPWYRVHDELLEFTYNVPAAHLRLVQPEEFAPISPEIDAWKKHIEVSIARQELVAYENDKRGPALARLHRRARLAGRSPVRFRPIRPPANITFSRRWLPSTWATARSRRISRPMNWWGALDILLR